LGDSADETGYDPCQFTPAQQSTAMTVAHDIVQRIAAGIFWPILNLDDDFLTLFPAKPEEGIAKEWKEEQEARIRNYELGMKNDGEGGELR